MTIFYGQYFSIDRAGVKEMLSGSGYSIKAIEYYNKAVAEYQSGSGNAGKMEDICTGCAPEECCKNEVAIGES